MLVCFYVVVFFLICVHRTNDLIHSLSVISSLGILGARLDQDDLTIVGFSEGFVGTLVDQSGFHTMWPGHRQGCTPIPMYPVMGNPYISPIEWVFMVFFIPKNPLNVARVSIIASVLLPGVFSVVDCQT